MKQLLQFAKRTTAVLLSVVLLMSAFAVCAVNGSAEAVVPRDIVLQSWTKWKAYTYGSGTLWATGCGMFSIVNAVGYLTGNEMDVVEVANWGHAIGGYNPGSSSAGTYRLTVYPQLEAKFGKDYGFTVDHNNGQGYWAGITSSTLVNHLKNGGVAIAHVPNHFIAVVGYDESTNYYHIYESFPNSKRGTNGTNGDIWRSASQLSTGNLKVDWFCLLSATGSPINRDYGETGCNVTFESNGGTDVASQSVDDGGTVTKPAVPSRWGFDFVGWYSDAALTTPYDFTATVSGDLTLYAKWTEAVWAENNNLMPNEQQLVIHSYNDGDEHIWPYYNADGSVTMYSGVTEEWAWPSASMEYEHSFDAAANAYIYVKKGGTAQFNAELTYMDAGGTLQSVLLSEIAGQGTTDFAEGDMEFFVNVGQYIYDQGHLPASGDVKYATITYYVIGPKDSYVQLYDMKFTPEFPLENESDITTSCTTLMNAPAAQGGIAGRYTYSDGVLEMTSTSAEYSVTFDVNATFDPSALSKLMLDLQSDIPFNITLKLLRADGEATMNYGSEFFNHFGLSAAPDQLPAGSWVLTAPDLNGYFEWNGGVVTSTSIYSVTVTAYGAGTLTLKALQATNGSSITYVQDGIYASDSLNESVVGGTALTSSVYNVWEQGIVSNVVSETTVADFLANFDQTNVAAFDAEGNPLADTALIATGMTVSLMQDGSAIESYRVSVRGDVNSDGCATTVDAREILIFVVEQTPLYDELFVAADYNESGTLDTTDVRDLLVDTVERI